MKSWITIAVLLGFLGVAVFGFTALNAKHGTLEESGLCLANIAKSLGCLEQENSFSSGLFHSEVFKKFSSAVLSLLNLVTGLFLVFLFLLLAKASSVPEAQFGFASHSLQSGFCPNIQTKFRNWFKYTEKRDPAF